jgi:DNA-binding NarL/FixJ family response regulator
MPRLRSCLAGNRPSCIPLLTASLAELGFMHPVVIPSITVTEIGRAAPHLLILDLDELEADPIDMLRMTRFVLPNATIAVYSLTLRQSWARSCHIAGANCLLSKETDEREIIAGLRSALAIGCFTDPGFEAA